MTPRRTTTGQVLERMMPPAFEHGGYEFKKQQRIGQRFGGGAHWIDWLVEKDGKVILVSDKWQGTSGTAEQKVPFEVLCLQEAVDLKKGLRAYLVLGGDGWKLRDFFVRDLKKFLKMPDVRIMTLESFITLASAGKL